jgi:hypothetical protein
MVPHTVKDKPLKRKLWRNVRLELAGMVSMFKRRRRPCQCKPQVRHEIPSEQRPGDLTDVSKEIPKTIKIIMCVVMEQSGSRPLPAYDKIDHRQCMVDDLLARFGMLRLED